jgi:hypothetical protein
MKNLDLISESLLEIRLSEPVAWGETWNSSSISHPLPNPCCLPIENDLKFKHKYMVAYLEMYGGAGLGANAGGVRVANIDRVQVKGIGSTILASAKTDKWHRHGALSLQDAVREAILSAIFTSASPFGAVQSLRVVDLLTNFATEIGEEKNSGSAPRALLYREQSIRIAHFMRSSFMQVGPALAEREIQRLRIGIPKFVDWLFAESQNGPQNFESITVIISRLFEKLMHQAAVLRTKRLVHGSLIPSNMTIEGKFLDFTTSTAVSTLQPVLVSPGGRTSQQQHLQILESLPDLIFYISKFDKRFNIQKSEIEEVSVGLRSHLIERHHFFLMSAHMSLYGFSQNQIKVLCLKTKMALFENLVRIISLGSTSGHVYFGGDEHPMIEQINLDDPFSIIAAAIANVCQITLPDSVLETSVRKFPVRLLDDLCVCIDSAIAEVGVDSGYSLSGPELGMSLLIRAMRSNADLSPLYRRNLDGVINNICSRRGNFGALIERTIKYWRVVFQDKCSGEIELNDWLCEESVILLSNGRLSANNTTMNPSRLVEFTPCAEISDRHAWLFRVAACNKQI